MATVIETENGRGLRLWPGFVLVVLIGLAAFVVPVVMPEAESVNILGPALGGLLICLWWVFFSRAAWLERLGAIAVGAAAVAGAYRLVHISIATAGMGYLMPILAFPVVGVALVLWAAATRNLSTTARRASMVVVLVAASLSFTLIRTGGVGSVRMDLHWRWTPTPEELLLAREAVAPPLLTPKAASPVPVAVEPSTPVGEKATITPADKTAAGRAETAAEPVADAGVEAAPVWPGFRGPKRVGVIRGVTLETNWAASPPEPLWRQPVGPGWSSFAVSGDLMYTQEQRGEDELVSCYNLTTGQPVWRHKDRARFWESNGGAGPRGTPTLSRGRVYTLGGTGIVNVLRAADGSLVWSRNAAADTGAKTPIWGFAGSPLVMDDLVVVAASGRLVAYELATGAPRWFGPKVGGGGYSSPHLVTVGGVPQVVLLRGGGAVAVAPGDGTVLWEHKWEEGASIVQPGIADGGDILLAGADASGGSGIRRLALSQGASGWTVETRWTTRGLKPYFNDFVVHKGHAYGFDGTILSSINLTDGRRNWKGGRYGGGQMMLLADQDLLFVSSEEGEIALVAATPEEFREVARFKAVEGKTWNHPVLAGDVLLVRNAEEMVAFRIKKAAVAADGAGPATTGGSSR
jgi:hypothetical protein